MPVEVAVAGQLLRPNRVYVLPSGRDITLSGGFFSLRPNTKNVGFSNVLTLFLQSLATSQHAGAAVILSGIEPDGAASLKAFRQRGGITIAQEPRTADRAEMPVAAILTGVVDHVLPPETIAGQLERIARDFQDENKNSQGGGLL
jgi:two-component system CheB/CheR fusion protein